MSRDWSTGESRVVGSLPNHITATRHGRPSRHVKVVNFPVNSHWEFPHTGNFPVGKWNRPTSQWQVGEFPVSCLREEVTGTRGNRCNVICAYHIYSVCKAPNSRQADAEILAYTGNNQRPTVAALPRIIFDNDKHCEAHAHVIECRPTQAIVRSHAVFLFGLACQYL